MCTDREEPTGVEPPPPLSRGRRFGQFDPVPLAKAPAQVVRGRLVVEHADHLHIGLVVQPVLLKAIDHPADNVISMRAEAKDGVDRGQAEWFGWESLWGRTALWRVLSQWLFGRW